MWLVGVRPTVIVSPGTSRCTLECLLPSLVTRYAIERVEISDRETTVPPRIKLASEGPCVEITSANVYVLSDATQPADKYFSRNTHFSAHRGATADRTHASVSMWFEDGETGVRKIDTIGEWDAFDREGEMFVHDTLLGRLLPSRIGPGQGRFQ